MFIISFDFCLFVSFSVFFLPRPCEAVFEFDVWPRTSEKINNFQFYYEIVPTNYKKYPETARLYVQHLFGPDINSEIIKNQTLPIRYPYVFSRYYNWVRDWNDSASTINPEYIRVSVLNSGGEVIDEYNQAQVKTIYWSTKFSTIEFGFEFAQGNVPGEGFVTVVPTNEIDRYFHENTKVVYVRIRKPPDWSQDNYLATDRLIPELDTVHVMFHQCPKILYFDVMLMGGYGKNGLHHGQASGRKWFALMCCDYVTGDCPAVDSAFDGPVFQVERVPGNQQFPLWKREIDIVEGTHLFFPWILSYYSPEFVQIEMPSTVSIAEWQEFYEIEELAGTECQNIVNCNAYKILKYQDSWGHLNIYSSSSLAVPFSFSNDVVYDVADEMFLKYDIGEWQKLVITPQSLHPVTPTPQKFLFAYTWSDKMFYKDYESYMNYGFNAFPRQGYGAVDVSRYSEYSYDNRKENWPNGLMFNSVIFPFVFKREENYLYHIHDDVSEASVVDTTKFPDDLPNLDDEIQQWQNAIDYFKATGKTDRCYRGFFYQQHLNVLKEWMDYTKPEFTELEILGLSGSSVIETIDQAKNCEVFRTSPDQTNEELYENVVKDYAETLGKPIENSINAYFQSSCYRNVDELWKTYEENGLTCQPCYYTYIKNPQMVNYITRQAVQGIRKYALKENWNYIPEITTCISGFITDLEVIFDYLIQLFSNGGTGYNLFHQRCVNDHAQLRVFSEFSHMISPYEDFVMNAEVGFHDFSLMDNIVIGSLKRGNMYMIGVSPNKRKSNQRAIEFSLPYSNSGFTIKDIRYDVEIERGENIIDPDGIRVNLEYQNGEIRMTFQELHKSTIFVIDSPSNSAAAIAAAILVPLVLIAVGIIVVIIAVVIVVALVLYFRKRGAGVEMTEDGKM